jgi:hypothetical protein
VELPPTAYMFLSFLVVAIGLAIALKMPPKKKKK